LVKLDSGAITPEERQEAMKMNISEADIQVSIHNYNRHIQGDDGSSSYHKTPQQQYDRPKSVNSVNTNPSQRDQVRGKSPAMQ